MVRRRRYQAHARCGMAGFANPLIYLMAGQLAALAGLGALGHFYLQFVCFGQVITGNAKTCRSHLFDGRAHGIAVWQRCISSLVFSPFAGIAFAA